MSVVTFTSDQISKLLSICDSSSWEEYKAALGESSIPRDYGSNMGRLVLTAELESLGALNKAVTVDWNQVCKEEEDIRCQPGHILSNLEARIRNATEEGHENLKELRENYHAFYNNTKATTLIVDKKFLKIGLPDEKKKRGLKTISSRMALDLSQYTRNEAHRDLPLCENFFYANELTPDTDIYGTGFFIDEDKVLTAAHVLEAAYFEGVSPNDLMFIRGLIGWNSKMDKIEVYEDQLYVLDEPGIIISDQMRYGNQRGDIAWIKVKPLYKGKTYPLVHNGASPEPFMKPTEAVYALGHGLGVPMKLSYNGKIQDAIYNDSSALFTCDMSVLPGSSGSPIFDSNSHKLVGIISGLHEIYTEADIGEKCANLNIDMNGVFSGVATYIDPFRSLIKQTHL